MKPISLPGQKRSEFLKTRPRFSFAIIVISILVILPLLAYLLEYSESTKSTTQSIYSIGAYLLLALSVLAIIIWWDSDIRKANAKRRAAEMELCNVKNALAVKNEKYRNLVENSGLIMFTASLDGIFKFVSDKAVELTGYSSRELKGMHFSQLISSETKKDVLKTYHKQISENTEETQIDFWIKTKDGSTKCVEQSAILLKSNDLPIGLQCVVKDISERKEMESVVKKYEQLLVQNQERLQSILDNATSMIYIKDLTGRYLLINKRFKEVFKLSDDEIIGKTDYEFARPEQAKRFSETDEKVKQTGMASELEEVIEIEGKKHTILITKFPLLDAQNKIYGVSGIATDITERVIYQQQLIEAKKTAEAAKIMQEQFLANMSHEIRTPMNGIQGMTDLLLVTSLNVEQMDFVKTIKRSSDNLLVIINDILDFSKIKAGKLLIEKIDFYLDEVLDNIKATFKHRVIEKGVDLQITVADNVPKRLNGDPHRLNQILINLTGNAMKFTSKGKVAIQVMAVKTKSGLALQFEITDTGIGIEQENIGQIFESFTQASIETSRKYGGTGLGLAITKQLIELQEGRISVKSILNHGTTFSFSLPFEDCKSDTPLLFAGNNSEKYHGLLEGKRFLVAEDNLVNQKVICHVLQKAGGTVDVANNGLEAIAFLNEARIYHLIIMDLQMPKMDGYAATKYIRNVMNVSTPIIAMTASALNGQKELCLEIGMNDYVSKPFDFANIYKKICLLIEEERMNVIPMHKVDGDNNLLFDLSMLEELQDDEYLTDVLTIFLDDTGKEISKMIKAFHNGDSNQLYGVAHKLKSSTGLLKILAMSKILTEIENKADKGDSETLKNLLNRLEQEYKKVASGINARLKLIREKQMINV